jgi:hypothetical protein
VNRLDEVVMKAKKWLIISLLFALFPLRSLFSFEEVSSRITSLGIGFVGLVPDAYTDMLRNPAYLPELDARLFPLTIQPETAYRLGIFIDPTPFLGPSMGAAVVSISEDSNEPGDTATCSGAGRIFSSSPNRASPP